MKERFLFTQGLKKVLLNNKNKKPQQRFDIEKLTLYGYMMCATLEK